MCLRHTIYFVWPKASLTLTPCWSSTITEIDKWFVWGVIIIIISTSSFYIVQRLDLLNRRLINAIYYYYSVQCTELLLNHSVFVKKKKWTNKHSQHLVFYTCTLNIFETCIIVWYECMAHCAGIGAPTVTTQIQEVESGSYTVDGLPYMKQSCLFSLNNLFISMNFTEVFIIKSAIS